MEKKPVKLEVDGEVVWEGEALVGMTLVLGSYERFHNSIPARGDVILDVDADEKLLGVEVLVVDT